MIPVGWAKLGKGVPFELNDLEFIYVQDAKYSGFQVSKDAGTTVIWFGCGIFFLGIIMVFYFPHRRVWMYLKQCSQSESCLQIRLFSNRSFGEAVEFQNLVNQLRRAFKIGNN